MSTTRTGPALDWSQAGSDLWSLVLDTARSKLIDVEQVGDEGNIPDRTDLRTGNLSNPGTNAPQMGGALGQPSAGMNWWMVGGLIAAAGAVVYFMAD